MVSTTGLQMQGEKVAVDNAGSVYASCFFGNSGEVHMADTVFQPTYQGVIIKLDSSGHFVRARAFQSAAGPRISCLGTDLYVGYYNTIAKLDSGLNTVWSITDATGALEFDQGCCSHADIFVQSNGELIASAYEMGNSTGAIPFGNDTVHFSAGNFNEEAVIKMDTSGQVLWTKALNFNGSQTGIRAVVLDHNGNAYFGVDQVTGQNVFGNDTLNDANGYCGILKWNAAGAPQWARGLYNVSGNGNYLYDLDVSAQNELLVSGSGGVISVNGDTTLAGLHQNAFLIKFNIAGNFQWNKAESAPIAFSSYADGVAVRNGSEYIQAGSTSSAGTHLFGCFAYSTNTSTNYIDLVSELPELYPTASFTFSVSNDTTYTFSDQSINATAWHWDFGDGDTSIAQNPVHSFSGGGNYTVTLIVYHGICSATDTLQIIDAGMKEAGSSIAISVSPNPFHQSTLLQLSSEFENGEIKIYNSLGLLLRKEKLSKQKNYILNRNELANGIYFIRVINNKGQAANEKLIVE